MQQTARCRQVKRKFVSNKICYSKLLISPFDTDLRYSKLILFHMWHTCFRRCKKVSVIGKRFWKDVERCN